MGRSSRSAQQKAAPCLRILGDSPQGGNVQAQDVFIGRIGSVSERGKEHERTKESECVVHNSHDRSINHYKT